MVFLRYVTLGEYKTKKHLFSDIADFARKHQRMGDCQILHPNMINSSVVAKKKSSRRVIINADDFGFSSGVNRAIIEAHERGVLTSTSLMVTGEAFDEAVTLAQAHPKLAVGLHLVLARGKSVLAPAQIPHLVDADGNFRESSDRAGVYYHLNSGARRELPLEIRAQLQKFRDTGLQISHVDGHLHMQMNPIVLHNLVALANAFNIVMIRLPSEELKLNLQLDSRDRWGKIISALVITGLRAYGERLLKYRGIAFCDRVYSWLQSGGMTEEFLLDLIPKIRANLVEIYSHPALVIPGEPRNGPVGAGQLELDALLSDRVREMLRLSGFELINYNQLIKERASDNWLTQNH